MTRIIILLPALTICLLLTVLSDGGACRSKPGATNKATVQSNEKLATGVWGGQHISAQVRDNGADIEFDCATATIDEAITLNTEGGFDVRGKFNPQHAGPIRDDEDNAVPARFVGQVKKQDLTLTITNLATKEPIGTFTLTQGSSGRIMKCK